MALRLQYREPCAISFVEGAWEYRWPDSTIYSPRTVLQWARPEQLGLLVGYRLEDVYCYEYLPGPGDTVLDVGAGIGCELFAFSRLVGDAGRVYAFEPHPGTFSLMSRNAAANGWSNVELINAAVADRAGTLRISDDDDFAVRSVVCPADGAVDSTIAVPALSIDDFVRERGIGHIDFVAMNIEGAERLAVRGMEQSIDIVDHLCISCHDFTGNPEMATKQEVRRWLEAHGFSVTAQPNCPPGALADFLYAARPGGARGAAQSNERFSTRPSGADEADLAQIPQGRMTEPSASRTSRQEPLSTSSG